MGQRGENKALHDFYYIKPAKSELSLKFFLLFLLQ